jgi:hypothetical protein
MLQRSLVVLDEATADRVARWSVAAPPGGGTGSGERGSDAAPEDTLVGDRRYAVQADGALVDGAGVHRRLSTGVVVGISSKARSLESAMERR